MYPQQQYAPQLPFSYNSLNSQPYQFGYGETPFIPNVPCPAHIQNYLPMIISKLLNNISNQAMASTLRVFHYNQISANNYQNNDYVVLVATAIDLMSLFLLKGVYRTVEEGIEDCVSKTNVVALCQILGMYPGLAQTLNQEQFTSISNFIPSCQALQQEIMMMKNNGGQQAPFRQGMPQQPMMNNQMSNQVPFGMGGGAGMQRPVNNGFSNINPNTAFVTQPSNVFGDDSNNRQYSYPKANPVPQQSTQPVGVVVMNKTVEVKPKAEEWRPTKERPYPFAINTDPNSLIFDDSSINQGNDMDRLQHTLVTTPQQKILNAVPEGVATRTQAINKSVSEFVKQSAAMITAGEGKHDYNTEAIVDSFLESAIFRTRIAQHVANEDTSCKVFQQQAYIETPIIAPEPFAKFVSETLVQATSFVQVAVLLEERLAVRDIEPSEVNAIMQLDKLLTKEINSILSNALSVPEISIDSFIDDVAELPAYLEKKHGLSYRKALLSTESNFITHHLTFLSVKDSNELFNNNYREIVEGVEVSNDKYCGIVVRSVPYTIIVADIIEQDLNLKLTARASAHAVQSRDFPALHKLISTSVNNTDAAHYYLVTSDNVLFEMHKGLLGLEFYLISKVN